MNRQQLLNRLQNKYEALDFCLELRHVIPLESKIALLEAEIWELKIKLKKLEGRKLDIKLIKQRMTNFKGIVNYLLEVNGMNANVYGDNGTGKTTQFDGCKWLKFGKDSEGRSKFKVKPQDSFGNEKHNLQTEVEAEFTIDGKPLKLRKMSEEKWTKKRGSAEAELTGNTISYWWDDEPVKESDYQKRISELIDEDVFMAITDPMYFNGKLSWQDRRKFLLTMCGDLTDEEVIARDTKLSRLTEILSGKSIEAYKKILAEKLSKLEKERKDVPPRIDELTRSLPQVQPDYSVIETELKEYQNIMAGIELDVTNASNTASAYRKKQQELYGLKGKLENVKTRINTESGLGSKKLVDEKSKLNSEKYQLEAEKGDYARQIPVTERGINENATKRQRLLGEWKELNETKAIQQASEFNEPDENSFSCPTCGQSLPEFDKKGKLAEMRSKFEKEKANAIKWVDEQLEKNKSAGIALKSSTEALQKSIEKYKSEIKIREEKLIPILARISEIEQELLQPASTPNYDTDVEYSSLQKNITALQTELDKPIEDTTSLLLQNKREIQEKIDGCNKVLNNKTIAEDTKKRIDELKIKEKQLAGQITELQGHEYLLDQFTVSKVNSLEDQINSHFKFVRFRMFENQVNGGISECCEALINTNGCWVPYSTNGNTAGKINAGIDCINALSNYYGIRAPIFVDNRESVSKLIDTDSQVINLIKSESDKALRVEVEG